MHDMFPQECKRKKKTYGHLLRAFNAFYLNDSVQAEVEIKKIMRS